MLKVGLSPKSPPGIALRGVFPLCFPPASSRPRRSIPQLRTGGLRMHLLGRNLVPFGRTALSLEKNHPEICLTQLKSSFSGSGEARAPGRQLPELACTFLSSAPAASPVVLPPTKSLLFVSLAGGIASGSAKLLLSRGPGCGVWCVWVFSRNDSEGSFLGGQL